MALALSPYAVGHASEACVNLGGMMLVDGGAVFG